MSVRIGSDLVHVPTLADQGPFDPDYDLFAEPPRRHSNPPKRNPVTYRPKLAPICRWCMDRACGPTPVLFHPDFAHLCTDCRIRVRMFIQHLAMHRAMTLLQATRITMSIMDLDNHLLPE